MKDNVTDLELIKRCINGNDKAAWEIFVNDYSKLIWNSIRKTFLKYSFRYADEDVEDMYSSVFVSLVDNDFKKLRQFRSENACSVSTWLTVITIRMTIDFLRKDKRHLVAEPAGDDQDIWNLISDSSRRADQG
jgi:RNA polymerase sigma factor (sigma-70 family)